MNIEQVRDKVYEEIADKTLSFGCFAEIYRVQIDPKTKELTEFCFKKKRIAYENIDGERIIDSNGIHSYKLKAVGHLIHIGVVMQWVKDNLKESIWFCHTCSKVGYLEHNCSNPDIQSSTFVYVQGYINSKRPQDELSSTIPLPGEPVGEERNDVLLFLNELIGSQ